ncbi:MAG: hypothetical protein U5L96_01555 [Owenweeksia sp.]|nr:hypothetical protein [Owenweeksia sp.]
MKRGILLIAMAMVSLSGWSQPTGTEKEKVEIEINENRVTIEADDLQGLSQVDINQIVREVTERAKAITAQHTELMAQVDRRLAQGDISEEQAADMRAMITKRTEESMEAIGNLMEVWGEQYEERMEAWEEDYEAAMEGWEEEVEARAEKGDFSVPPLPPLPAIPAPDVNYEVEEFKNGQRKVVINAKGIRIEEGPNGEKTVSIGFEDDDEVEEEERDEDKDDQGHTDGYFDINFGYNQMLRDGQNFITSGSEELNFWGSNVFDLGAGWKTCIWQAKECVICKVWY